MKTYNVISLGAGVQSSTMLLMADKGLFEKIPDFAIFADTGDEPGEVYDWLKFLLEEVKNIPIYVERKDGSYSLIGDYLEAIAGVKKRAPSIPFYTKGEKKEGKLIRQCTVEYKIDVVWKAVRKKLGYEKGTRFKDHVNMWIGISVDEIMRAKPSKNKHTTNHYPLLDKWMTRNQCLEWLASNVGKQAPKSSCIYCPYHSDRAWKRMKEKSPEEFEYACWVDDQIRINPKLDKQSYIHRSCIPLREVEFIKCSAETEDDDHFNNSCIGMCGI